MLVALALGAGACERSPSAPSDTPPAAISSAAPTPPPPSCASVATDHREKNVAADAGRVEIPVSAEAGCTWTASTTAEFLKLDPTESTGEAVVHVEVAGNIGTERRGAMLIAGATVTIVQAAPPPPPPPPTPPSVPCFFSVSPVSANLGAAGGSTSVAVTTAEGCQWTVAAASSFVTATPASGAGPGSVTITTAANGTTSSRTATLTIASQTVTVRQAACTISLNPQTLSVPAGGGSATAAVGVDGACGWTVTQGPSYITVTPTAGTSAGTVTIAVGANGTSSPRTATFSIGGRTMTVSQQAGTPSWPPPGPLPPIVPPAPPPGATTYLTLRADPGDPRPSGTWVSPTARFAEINRGSLDVLVTTPTGNIQLQVIVPSGPALTPGTYEDANDPMMTLPGFSIRGQGFPLCPDASKVPSRFTIHEAVTLPNRAVQRFRMTFEQHCSGAAPGLVGELVYAAPVYSGPIAVPPPPPGATTYMTFRGDVGNPGASGLSRADAEPTAAIAMLQHSAAYLDLSATGADGKTWGVTLKSGRGPLAIGTYEYAQEDVNANPDVNAVTFMLPAQTATCVPYSTQARFQVH